MAATFPETGTHSIRTGRTSCHSCVLFGTIQLLVQTNTQAVALTTEISESGTIQLEQLNSESEFQG